MGMWSQAVLLGAWFGLLHAFDADTGRPLFRGGGPNDAMEQVQVYQTPIVAKGRIYVAAKGRVYAFTVK